MKIIKFISLVLLFSVVFFGCSSSQPNIPKVKTSEKFKVEGINLNLIDSIKTEIKYHTKDELENILSDMIVEGLRKKELLSSDIKMNTLKINVVYKRHFVGDKTPFPSDSLAYPFVDYKIDILSNTNPLTTIQRYDLTYNGGFAMNLKVIAARLKDKKYELEFLQATANKIVDEIESLKE